VQWIADQRPETHLAPPNGTLERSRLQQWLIHLDRNSQELLPMFSAETPRLQRSPRTSSSSLRYVNDQLKGKQFLLGNHFTVADGYLFTVRTGRTS